MNNEYGAVADVVSGSLSLVAAVGAIAWGWKRRSKWEPIVEDTLDDAAPKVVSVVNVVGLAILWWSREVFPQTLVVSGALVALGVCILSLLVYRALITLCVFDQEVPTTESSTRKQKIIGGFWLTSRARAGLAEHNVQQILARAENDPDNVWPRAARALANACFLVAYMGLSAGGTLAVAGAGFLVGGAIDEGEQTPLDHSDGSHAPGESPEDAG